MKTIALRNNKFFAETSEDAQLEKSQRRWTNAFIFALAMTAVAGPGGIVLSAVAFFMENVPADIGRAGSILISSSFVLLIATAHCMDKISETKKALRVLR